MWGSWEDLGIEAAFKCRALKVPSCREVIAYSWCVGSVISQPCKLCHLLIPPSRVADATQPSCLLAVKGTLKFFTTKNERSLKLPEKCVWMPDQVSESYHLQGEGLLPGRALLSPFLLRKTTGRICLLPLFTLCRNCIDRECWWLPGVTGEAGGNPSIA